MGRVRNQTSNPELNFDLSLESVPSNFRERINKEQLVFASRGEMVCGAMLRKYLNVKMINGVTFQRPMAHGTKADFFLPEQGITLEFHPIVLSHEFKRRESFYKFSQAMTKLHFKEREVIYRSLEAEFRDRYFWIRNLHRRSSTDAEVKSSSLVVVDSPAELFDSIIHQYGSNVPSRSEFISEFRFLMENRKRCESIIYS